MNRIAHYILIITLVLTVAISGCGGGGDHKQSPGSSLSAPQITKVTAADKQLTVEWTAVAGAASYLVWWGTTNDTGTSSKTSHEITDNSYTITGLTNGTTYYIFVQAKNSAGVSTPSSLVNGTPISSLTVPAAPGTPVLTPGDRQITVNWSSVTGATGYQVWYGTSSSSSSASQYGSDITTGTSCTIASLTNGTTYYVWVKAKNDIGTSDFSNPANMAPGPPTAPAAPVLSLGDDNCINVSWTPIAGATGYEVHYSAGGSEILYTDFNTSGNTYTIPLPDYGTMNYAVWVIAKNDAGKSGNSPSTSVQYIVSIGEIAGGNGSYANGDKISFGKTFSTTPVVIVNAHDASGKPLIAGIQPGSLSTTGFNVKVYDLSNVAVTGNVTVQWVAIIPNTGLQVQARTDSYHYNNEYVSFNNSFSLPPNTPLIVICSAYEKSGSYPLLAAPYNISASGFSISLRNADGDPEEGSLTYIALIPKSHYNYYQEAAIVSNYTTYNNNGSVSFNLTRNADAVLCSAQKNNFAYAVAARNNTQYRFDLGLLDYDGAAGTSVWTSWIALGFK